MSLTKRFNIPGFNDEIGKTEVAKRQLMLEPNPDRLFFDLPPNGIPPKEFVEQHFGKNAPLSCRFLKGTTTLGFVYEPKTENDKGGIIVAVDSRASGGTYIASRTVMKILEISDSIVGTMAGGAADCQFWVRFLAKYCSLYELREKQPISVAAASKYLANVLYNYKGMGISVGTMIAGFDKSGPSIYYVDAEGMRCKGKSFSIGSGSLGAYGVMDTFYKSKMTDQEAMDLGRKAIMHATIRDIGSGGLCNLAHITPDGVTRYPAMDVNEMYHEFAAEMNREDVDPSFD